MMGRGEQEILSDYERLLGDAKRAGEDLHRYRIVTSGMGAGPADDRVERLRDELLALPEYRGIYAIYGRAVKIWDRAVAQSTGSTAAAIKASDTGQRGPALRKYR